MIEVTHPPARAVNQLNTSYIIDILVITFPKAHLCKIYFILIMSNRKQVQYPEIISKALLMQVYSDRVLFWALGVGHTHPSSQCQSRAFHMSTSVPYLAIFRTHAHVFSTFIQANLIYLHRTLFKKNKQTCKTLGKYMCINGQMPWLFVNLSDTSCLLV